MILVLLLAVAAIVLPTVVLLSRPAPADDGISSPGPVSGPVSDAVSGPVPEVADGDKVFAHYFPAYPVSIDNEPPSEDYYARGYLQVDGEDGKHAAYGGLLRDRPLGRDPLPGDWKVTDMRTEIQQAKDAGIDGFTLDILELSGRTWDIGVNLMTAADREGDFEIIPTLDASAVDATPEQVASAVAKLMAHPSAQQIGGEHVMASFLAEGKAVTWWSDVLDTLASDYDTPVKFIAVFNSPSEENMAAFAPISYGLGSWGTRTAEGAAAAPDLAAQAHALGKTWMAAVAVQDARPRSSTYAEAGNTETLRTTWGRAIADQADFVQIATWNDYSESTSIAPSVMHGSVFLDLCAYYADWFTHAQMPAITSDRIVLTHRTQPWAATPTSGIANMEPTLGGTDVQPRDTVEALVFLTAPATVTVTSGSHTMTSDEPAGISSVLVELGEGRPSASITRGTDVVASVVSPYDVTSAPYVQDLEYVAAAS